MSKHKDLLALAIKINGFFIAVLGVVAGYFQFKSTHPTLFILACAAIFLLSLFELILWCASHSIEIIERIHSGKISEVDNFILGIIAKHTQLLSGILIPGSGKTPIIPRVGAPAEMLKMLPPEDRDKLERASTASETAFVIFLGNSAAWTEEFPHTVLKHKDKDVITIGKANIGMWVSAELFNERGEIICQLKENKFHINQNSVFRSERLSPHRLQIINNRGHIALDVDLINRRCIRFLGDFYTFYGARAIITDERQTLGNYIHSRSVAANNPVSFGIS